ncbi:MAG TPA: hypothetical protein VGK67_04900 [Myxococcales bacterium]|jgi:hypothetical protein
MGESADDNAKKKRDLLFVHGKSAKGDRYKVIRAREDRIEMGEMSDLKEGEEIRGEVVKLKARSEHPQLFDVETVVPREESGGAHSGPAQVATEEYRKNFDSIFGAKKRKKRELLN